MNALQQLKKSNLRALPVASSTPHFYSVMSYNQMHDIILHNEVSDEIVKELKRFEKTSKYGLPAKEVKEYTKKLTLLLKKKGLPKDIIDYVTQYEETLVHAILLGRK